MNLGKIVNAGKQPLLAALVGLGIAGLLVRPPAARAFEPVKPATVLQHAPATPAGYVQHTCKLETVGLTHGGQTIYALCVEPAAGGLREFASSWDTDTVYENRKYNTLLLAKALNRNVTIGYIMEMTDGSNSNSPCNPAGQCRAVIDVFMK